ncbi:ornithine cyclodeaminase [Paracoccus homiensis]|uniref:Ornithine cyclodeaminase n=1 Tax=Paracoccus homiensis TaxID=364199 RepID=A0A1I0D661_9RHOB|nr:ornithine cyclodeaminase [Paracoccus homiensis]
MLSWKGPIVTDIFLTEHQLETALDWRPLVEELRDWFARNAVVAPPRQVLPIRQPDGSEASLLIMPAWIPGESIGVKIVTFFPENPQRGLATINAGYMLFDGETGQMKSVMDGDALTARRTAAASALAADYLARKDARTLLVVGTGQLSRAMAAAHSSVRNHDRIMVWGRNCDSSARIAGAMREDGLPAEAVTDLEQACRSADVITTVTAATSPIIHGDWLRPGTHLDLVGAFREDMREADDTALGQSRVFVDSVDGAMKSGDLAQPTRAGLFDPIQIEADLAELAQGRHPGRGSDAEFTLFKSAGVAIEDLAAAELAHRQVTS